MQLDGGQGDVGGGRHHGHGAGGAGLQGDRHQLLLPAPGCGGADVDPLLPCLRIYCCLELFVLLFQSLHELSGLLLVEDYWPLHRSCCIPGIHLAVKF